MKIDIHHPLYPVNQPSQESPKKVEGPARGNTGNTDPAVQTHLQRESAATDQDIDLASVEAIREAIREGRLDIRADRIADGLIASVRDLLER
ncbi:flagellar biosynthesis anti-sigma factor FlgM [Halochromatium salexigens]|uniref:Negative regulator of flagellin synthesis n=1 Tax=Halochromatium salexigens TaxID=49447 RepID=A0AAJ0UE61_HALSE|nr:flagellar biosynthesis anti-sigma factor FlgM [Halochromatium salexigens]MBK5929772.1 flagellar biosynthesis anti-sigma factor FlgM [Halochromatium salexigens]